MLAISLLQATRTERSAMDALVAANDFPTSRTSAYLNAASVALMYRGAERAAIDWQEDVASNGTINFDEAAEESVFADLHRAGARLFNAKPDDIAVGASATRTTMLAGVGVAPAARPMW